MRIKEHKYVKWTDGKYRTFISPFIAVTEEEFNTLEKIAKKDFKNSIHALLSNILENELKKRGIMK